MTIRTNPLMRPAVIVGGGPVDPEALRWACSSVDRLIAADGGAAAALDAGLMPDAVIGDMDSLDKECRARIPQDRLHHVAEQNSTDFAKCLSRAEAPWVIGLGFLGARIDHTLAALNVMLRFDPPALLLGPDDLAIEIGRAMTLDLPLGMRLSLFPFAPVTGRSEGLQWPIDGIDFAPNDRVGTSNRVVGPVRLWMDGPGMVLLLPPEARDAALGAMTG